MRDAFHTEIHNLEVRGEKHIANMRDPQIPAALAPAIAGIVSLHDFKPRAQHEMRKAGANYTFNDPVNGPTFAVVPADLATIYNLESSFQCGLLGPGADDRSHRRHERLQDYRLDQVPIQVWPLQLYVRIVYHEPSVACYRAKQLRRSRRRGQ